MRVLRESTPRFLGPILVATKWAVTFLRVQSLEPNGSNPLYTVQTRRIMYDSNFSADSEAEAEFQVKIVEAPRKLGLRARTASRAAGSHS